MSELDSRVVVKEVIDRLDNTVPMLNGAVILEPIVWCVLEVLAEHFDSLEVEPVPPSTGVKTF